MQEPNIDILQEMDPAQIFSFTGDSNVQEVIGHLKFMSKIKQGEKIDTRNLFVRDNDSMIQRFFRTVKNAGAYVLSSEVVESKNATLSFIQNTVNDAINLISIYRRDQNEFRQSIADIIVQNLEMSKIGIRNLIATYQYDRKFISDAEAVIQTVEARISSLKKQGYMSGISEESFMPNVDVDNSFED